MMLLILKNVVSVIGVEIVPFSAMNQGCLPLSEDRASRLKPARQYCCTEGDSWELQSEMKLKKGATRHQFWNLTHLHNYRHNYNI